MKSMKSWSYRGKVFEVRCGELTRSRGLRRGRRRLDFAARDCIDGSAPAAIPTGRAAIPHRCDHDADIERCRPERSQNRLGFAVLFRVREEASVRDREERPRRNRNSLGALAPKNCEQLQSRRHGKNQRGNPSEDGEEPLREHLMCEDDHLEGISEGRRRGLRFLFFCPNSKDVSGEASPRRIPWFDARARSSPSDLSGCF